jgi:hypothetical protein
MCTDFLSLSYILLCFGSSVEGQPSDLSLHDMSGKKVRLREYRGKIVVLDFWAT